MTIENVAKDYSKYCDVDINTKLKPVNKSIDDMFARLEEFQTILAFVKQDGKDANEILNSFPKYKKELDEVCDRIDTVENLMTHMKSNLDKLEDDLDKAELECGCNDKTKVTKIFTPLFRKNSEKKLSPNVEVFRTEDYFN